MFRVLGFETSEAWVVGALHRILGFTALGLWVFRVRLSIGL